MGRVQRSRLPAAASACTAPDSQQACWNFAGMASLCQSSRMAHRPSCLPAHRLQRVGGAKAARSRAAALRRLKAAGRDSSVGANVAEETALASPAWRQFAEAASGEWEGATSTFSADGDVRELPRNFVPEAYREWGIEIVDWTHMSSSLADDSGLLISVKRFMPTVGCEADAVAYVDETVKALKSEDDKTWEAKTIAADGSYSIGTRVLASDGDGFMKHRIEACMAVDKERVRVVWDIRRRDAESAWKVMNIDLFKEELVSEYMGGTELRSCGGSVGFGAKPRLDADAGNGLWRATAGTAYTCGKDQAFRCATFEAREQELDVADVVCLPLSVWSRVTVSGNDVLVESGWLHAPNKKKTVLRDYHDAVLQRVELTDWTRDSAV